MSAGTKMPLVRARYLARKVIERLAPHCERIEIAGSIRRGKSEVGDIEIVCIPKKYADLLGNDLGNCPEFVAAVSRWECVKGNPETGLYTQRILPVDGSPRLDLFMTDAKRWGLTLLIRTGSAEFNMKFLRRLDAAGVKMMRGRLYDLDCNPIPAPEESDVFKAAKMEFIEPEKRI